MHPADRPSERARASKHEIGQASGGGRCARAAAAAANARSIHYRGRRERETGRERERGPIANSGRPRDRRRRRRRSFCTGAAGPTATGFVRSRQHLCVKKQCCGEKGMVHFLRIKPNQREWKQIARFIHFLVPGSIPDSLHGRVDIIWSQSSSASNGPNAV